MSSDTPLDLDGYGDIDSPDVVRRAAGRFRRRLFACAAVVALLALSAGFLLAQQPGDTTPRGLLDQAAVRHEAGGQLRQDGLSLVVLEAGRVSEGIYVLHIVGVAERLDDQEALDLSIPVSTLIPPPGQEPADLPGHQVQTLGIDPQESGYGPGRHVVQAWVVLPTGTRTVPVDFLAGVPQRPSPPGASPDHGDPADASPSNGAAPRGLPPTVEGTGRRLGTIELDVKELQIPEEIWQ